jgi:very-short-patch-repair endonuclease
MDQRRLAQIARRQRGLFTRRDASQCGYSAYQVRKRIASGEWRRVVGSVLVAGGTKLTQAHDDLAALLAVPGSVLAGPAAARAWGIPVTDDRTMLLVDTHCSVRLTGVLLTFGRIGPRDFTLIEGARVTPRDRTVFDCLRILNERLGLELLERSLQQGWVTRSSLGDQIQRHRGHHGVPRVRHLLQASAGGEHSAAERVLTGLLKRAGITGWRVNVPISDDRGLIGVGDLVFAQQRVIIEVDGWAYHVSARTFQHDRARQNRLVAAGWTVLRFTWRDLTDRADDVLASVRRLVG